MPYIPLTPAESAALRRHVKDLERQARRQAVSDNIPNLSLHIVSWFSGEMKCRVPGAVSPGNSVCVVQLHMTFSNQPRISKHAHIK